MDFAKENFHDNEADWLFLSSFAGDFEALEAVFSYAKSKDIKIAMIPGKDELQEKERIQKLIPQVEILVANKEELAMIFSGDTLEELVRDANKVVHYVVGTDGSKGAVATDRWHIVNAGMYENVEVIDRTGAGDAFASGFVAMIAAGESLEKAITLASANSTSVVTKIGAKAGILSHTDHVHDMPLEVKEL
jgi:ribokinase